MSNIQVFDPALCCSTGVCGTEVDPVLVDFAAAVDWAKKQGAVIERFNLSQQPLVFAENETVKLLMRFVGGVSNYQFFSKTIHRNRVIKTLASLDRKDQEELIHNVTRLKAV